MNECLRGGDLLVHRLGFMRWTWVECGFHTNYPTAKTKRGAIKLARASALRTIKFHNGAIIRPTRSKEDHDHTT